MNMMMDHKHFTIDITRRYIDIYIYIHEVVIQLFVKCQVSCVDIYHYDTFECRVIIHTQN